RNVTQRGTELHTPVRASTTFVDSLRGPLHLLARLPARKIASQDEEFSANLNDWNAIFFNDSAEMPDRKACQFGGRRDIQEHLGAGVGWCCGFSQHRGNS